MPTYHLTIAYDGSDFHGWQRQFRTHPVLADSPADPPVSPDAPSERGRLLLDPDSGRHELRTVQRVVERAVREVVREPVHVQGASRTDSGVHARGQAASFVCSGDAGPDAEAEPRGAGWPIERGVDRLVRAINGRLPDDVLVLDAAVARPGFDVVCEVESKGYSYTLHTSDRRPLWDRRFVHHVYWTLDVPRMHDAAQQLVGEHDFAAFAAAGHGRQTTVRRVFQCDVSRLDPDRIRIDVAGSGFLWHMVRIIAGTLVEVGRSRKSLADVQQALLTGDRRRAGPTMPASGLCLEWIRYRPTQPPL